METTLSISSNIEALKGLCWCLSSGRSFAVKFDIFAEGVFCLDSPFAHAPHELHCGTALLVQSLIMRARTLVARSILERSVV